MHEKRAYQRCIRSVSAASRGTSPVLVSVRFSRVSGMYQECISLTEDGCLIRVSGVYQLGKDA